MTKYIIFLIAAFIVMGLALEFLKTEKNKSSSDKIFPYRKRDLLTKAEYKFYWKLKEIADSHQLNIFIKVRLADILEVIAKNKEWKIYFNKIQSKHVDFLLCDENLYIRKNSQNICGIDFIIEEWYNQGYKSV